MCCNDKMFVTRIDHLLRCIGVGSWYQDFWPNWDSISSFWSQHGGTQLASCTNLLQSLTRLPRPFANLTKSWPLLWKAKSTLSRDLPIFSSPPHDFLQSYWAQRWKKKTFQGPKKNWRLSLPKRKRTSLLWNHSCGTTNYRTHDIKPSCALRNYVIVMWCFYILSKQTESVALVETFEWLLRFLSKKRGREMQFNTGTRCVCCFWCVRSKSFASSEESVDIFSCFCRCSFPTASFRNPLCFPLFFFSLRGKMVICCANSFHFRFILFLSRELSK